MASDRLVPALINGQLDTYDNITESQWAEFKNELKEFFADPLMSSSAIDKQQQEEIITIITEVKAVHPQEFISFIEFPHSQK